MPDKIHYASKLDTVEKRCAISVDRMTRLATQVLQKSGVDPDVAKIVAQHLVEANLSGVESHGVVRLMQYTQQFESGYMHANRQPRLTQNEKGAWVVDGDGGIGIPAMILAMDHGCTISKEKGISATAIGNCGHTGRLGAYAEKGANNGCLTIIIGGGGREAWRQVAPYGGRKAVLPTNPYAFGIPGGKRGPVVLDFATSKIAGGWIYAAESAQTLLPESAVIDRHGNPTRKPEDYFQGGAILPFGGAKGYAISAHPHQDSIASRYQASASGIDSELTRPRECCCQ